MKSLLARQPVSLRPWLRLLPGLVMLGGIVYVYDPAKIQRSLATVDWWLAVPSILGLILVHLFQVESWRLLSRLLSNIDLSWRFAARTYYIAQACGSVTPANVGADVYRAYAVDRERSGWRGAFVPIISQRLMSYLALILLAATCAVTTGPYARPFAVVTAACLALAYFGARILRRKVGSGWNWNISLLKGPFTRLTGLESMPVWRQFCGPMICALLFHFFSMLFTYVLVVAVAGHASVVDAVATLALARLATMLPFVPYGLGVQEGALVIALPSIGVSAEAAIAVSMLSRIALLGTILVGGITWLLTQRAQKAQPTQRVEGVAASSVEAA
jgi:uncharacterized membrane protein YbhN (UPF0104 family)